MDPLALWLELVVSDVLGLPEPDVLVDGVEVRLPLSEVLALVVSEEEGVTDPLALWLELVLSDVLGLPEEDVLTD